MQTVTLSISDDFMAKFNALLDILPKNKVKVKSMPNSKIDIMTSEIKESLLQAKSGNTVKTGKKIKLNAKS